VSCPAGMRSTYSARDTSFVSSADDGASTRSKIRSRSSPKSRSPFLHHRPELDPELLVGLAVVLQQLLEPLDDLLDEVLADRLDLAVLLEHLARDVEREILRVDDAAHEAQPFGQELAALVHDEDAADVELDTIVAALAVVEVVGRAGGDEEERAGLEGAFEPGRDAEHRGLVVVGDVFVELVELARLDLALGAGPDRLHRVEGRLDRAMRRELARRGVVRRRLDHGQPDRIGDEIRVFPNDLSDHPLVAEVGDARVGVDGLEVQADRRARRLAGRVLEAVFAGPLSRSSGSPPPRRCSTARWAR
jgi:hypothetical protein